MQEQQCSLIRMITEDETEHEKIIRYKSGDDKKVDEVTSLFDFNPKEYARNHHLPREMARGERSGQYEYNADSSYSYLYEMTLYQVLPQVTVKKKYRDRIEICWAHYPGLNVVKNAIMFGGEKTVIQTSDSKWSNIDNQFYGNKKIDHINHYLGHVPALIEWTHKLPKFPLRVLQPWSFCKGVPFPLFKAKEKIYFSYKTCSSIFELLRVRVLKDGQWTYISPTKEANTISKYLNFPDKGSLPSPIMIAEYSKITHDEEMSIKGDMDHYVVEDIKRFSSEIVNKTNPKVTIEVDIEDSIKGIFYVAENLDATLTNNLSNFSTNATEILDGDKPIKGISLKYENSPLVPLSAELTPSVLADYIESHYAINYFKGYPRDPGYAAIPLAYDMHTANHETFKSGKFTAEFELSDKDDDSDDDSDEREKDEFLKIGSISSDEVKLSHSYKVHMYVLYLKRISFIDGKVEINKIAPPRNKK
ncbi:Divergent Major Capsid Protein [Cedratvirus A11]|uniref:Divergent Major Capsid Protein n=1 Tax=Cedratvirus A11 TaxID=1903266 RepID=A0A1M7XU17_9VIRU|nr:Divergent Major Capsid Protein [Cedratvirus A11]SHO33196.1 Divergent Major Capsid Protein [Cedratvirus A11]